MNKVGIEEKGKAPETRKGRVLREFFFLIYVMLTLAYTGLIAYFIGSAMMILNDLKNGSSNALARDMVDVWKNNYIITDIASTSTNRCPLGYVFAYEYNWPGINAICSCPYYDGDNIDYVAYYGNCTSDQIIQQCIQSNQINSQNLNKWRSFKRLCVKYGSDTFFSMPMNCDSNSAYKKCGQGDTQICVKTNESCPITSLIVSSNKLMGTQYSSALLDSSNYLYYKYDGNYFPVSFFKISNTFFCAFHSKDFTPNQASFLLSDSAGNFQCDIIDQEFQIVDEIGQSDFYRINNLLNSLNSIPSYPKPTNEYSTYLGSRSYQYWTYFCRNSADYNLAKTDEMFSLSTDTSYQIGLIIVTIVSLVISGILLPSIDLCKRYFMGLEKRADAKVLKTSTLILDKFFRFSLFPLIIVCYTQVKNEINWLASIEDFKCSTEFFITTIKNPHLNSLNNLSSFYGDMLALWVLMVILDIIYLTVRFLTDRKKELIIKAKKPLSDELQPLNKNKIVPQVESSTPPKNEKTDLEDNQIDVADIKKVEQELAKTINEANLPSKAEIKGLEMELKGAIKDMANLNKNNIDSHDYLIEKEEKKTTEEDKPKDSEIPKRMKTLPPLKAVKNTTPNNTESNKDFENNDSKKHLL